MRRALMYAAATLVATAGPTSTALARGGSDAHHDPSKARVQRALQTAESSTFLWATVNVCVPNPDHGGLIGIRGEMPALGFGSTLSMTIQLNQRSNRTGTYSPVPGATASRTVTLGTYKGNDVHQGGVEFPYATDTARLNATVTFIWSRDGDQLGQVTQTTTGGHPQADFGQPPHHSSATCKF